ncbi:MAG: hypothetical protein ACK5HP_00920 [Bacilli bacterium]
MNKYDEIINLQRPISIKHKKMLIESRSAQFAPFAALTGFNEEIEEKARLTDMKIELDEESIFNLNQELIKITEKIYYKPKVSILYFVKDNKKIGGKYITLIDNVRKIDNVYNQIILINNKINIDDILKIEIIHEKS